MYQILERINEIALLGTYWNGTAYTALGIQGLYVLPETLDRSYPLPVMIALPRGTGTFVYDSASRHASELSFDLRFYLEATGGNKALNTIEAFKYSDAVIRTFLARPQLQSPTTDAPVTGVAGNLTIQITSNLNTKLEYPIGVQPSQGSVLFWGFIARLTVPYRILVKPNFKT